MENSNFSQTSSILPLVCSYHPDQHLKYICLENECEYKLLCDTCHKLKMDNQTKQKQPHCLYITIEKFIENSRKLKTISQSNEDSDLELYQQYLPILNGNNMLQKQLFFAKKIKAKIKEDSFNYENILDSIQQNLIQNTTSQIQLVFQQIKIIFTKKYNDLINKKTLFNEHIKQKLISNLNRQLKKTNNENNDLNNYLIKMQQGDIELEESSRIIRQYFKQKIKGLIHTELESKLDNTIQRFQYYTQDLNNQSIFSFITEQQNQMNLHEKSAQSAKRIHQEDNIIDNFRERQDTEFADQNNLVQPMEIPNHIQINLNLQQNINKNNNKINNNNYENNEYKQQQNGEQEESQKVQINNINLGEFFSDSNICDNSSQAFNLAGDPINTNTPRKQYNDLKNKSEILDSEDQNIDKVQLTQDIHQMLKQSDTKKNKEEERQKVLFFSKTFSDKFPEKGRPQNSQQIDKNMNKSMNLQENQDDNQENQNQNQNYKLGWYKPDNVKIAQSEGKPEKQRKSCSNITEQEPTSLKNLFTQIKYSTDNLNHNTNISEKEKVQIKKEKALFIQQLKSQQYILEQKTKKQHSKLLNQVCLTEVSEEEPSSQKTIDLHNKTEGPIDPDNSQDYPNNNTSIFNSFTKNQRKYERNSSKVKSFVHQIFGSKKWNKSFNKQKQENDNNENGLFIKIENQDFNNSNDDDNYNDIGKEGNNDDVNNLEEEDYQYGKRQVTINGMSRSEDTLKTHKQIYHNLPDSVKQKLTTKFYNNIKNNDKNNYEK